jgi:tRNA-binding EMAP/Myf-like protein
MQVQTKKVQVKIKSVYGVDKIYPISEEAQIFAEMIGQKTLTVDNIKYIKMLGYVVEVVSDAVQL